MKGSEEFELFKVKCSEEFELFLVKGSEEFENFLHCLGDTIELKGWTGYRGGLDVAGKWLSSSRWVLRFESFVFPTLTELQSFPSKNDVQHNS